MLLEITSPVRVLREPRATDAGCCEVADEGSCSAILYFFSDCLVRSVRTVSSLPMSRRSKRNLLGRSSWPLCCCKRRCRLSWRKSRLLVSNSSVLNSVISFIFILARQPQYGAALLSCRAESRHLLLLSAAERCKEQ